MSLASNCAPQYPCADSFQAYCLYDNEHVGDYLQLPGTTSLEDSCHNGHRWAMFEDSGFLDSLLDHQACHLPALTEPCNSSSSRIFSFGNLYSQPEDLQSILQCKASSECSSSNPLMLSFEQKQPNSLLKFSYGKNSAVWNGNLSSDHQLHQANRTCSTNPFQPQEMNCLETGNAHGAVISILKENKIEEEMDWLYSEEMPAGDALQQRRGPGGGSYKRPYVVVDVPSPKRLCDSGPRNSETKPATSSKDPQSIAAKNRRKRISERLKILQDLVPNGTKLDSVTMLEKAISYVKFLQLQVKVLTADELWPTQGGKATDAAQMKEAIDAILSLQRIEPLAQSYQSNKP